MCTLHSSLSFLVENNLSESVLGERCKYIAFMVFFIVPFTLHKEREEQSSTLLLSNPQRAVQAVSIRGIEKSEVCFPLSSTIC